MSFVDIHCHLLPGIDDGAQDMSSALLMTEMAVSNGIERIVLTPHIQPGIYDNNLASIQSVFAEYQAAVAAAEIDVELGFAAECHLTPEILSAVESGQVPYLGEWEGEKVILLELPHTSVPAGALQLIRWLRANNIRPLIAHPERNQEIIRYPEKIRPLASMGALLQLTAGSLTGVFGSKSRHSVEQILKAGLGHVIASDAHNLGRRSPELLAGMQVAAGIIGESKAGDMVDATPRQLTASLFK